MGERGTVLRIRHRRAVYRLRGSEATGVTQSHGTFGDNSVSNMRVYGDLGHSGMQR